MDTTQGAHILQPRDSDANVLSRALSPQTFFVRSVARRSAAGAPLILRVCAAMTPSAKMLRRPDTTLRYCHHVRCGTASFAKQGRVLACRVNARWLLCLQPWQCARNMGATAATAYMRVQLVDDVSYIGVNSVPHTHSTLTSIYDEHSWTLSALK